MDIMDITTIANTAQSLGLNGIILGVLLYVMLEARNRERAIMQYMEQAYAKLFEALEKNNENCGKVADLIKSINEDNKEVASLVKKLTEQTTTAFEDCCGHRRINRYKTRNVRPGHMPGYGSPDTKEEDVLCETQGG